MGLILGLAIIPIAQGMFILFSVLSQSILLWACSLLTTAVLALSVYIIFLSNKVVSYTKIIKELSPNIDIDAYEEYSLGWDEAEQYDKNKKLKK